MWDSHCPVAQPDHCRTEDGLCMPEEGFALAGAEAFSYLEPHVGGLNQFAGRYYAICVPEHSSHRQARNLGGTSIDTGAIQCA